MFAPGTMSLAELQKLIADSKGEWEHLEFKKTTGELHGGMETLSGFLNGSGGKVLFGVNTAGKVQGQDVTDSTFQEVANAIRKLEPPALIKQSRIPVSGMKEVLMLETIEQADGPYISTGLLPAGITVADLKQDHPSAPPNPLIAGVFFRRGLIEQWGRGTQKIVGWCVAAGQPEPEFEEQAGAVVVRFRPSGYHPPLRVSHDLTDRQRHLLLILSDRRKWKVQDVLAQLENPPGLRSLQLDLRMLRDLRLVQTSGRGGNARWWIAPTGE